MCAILLSKGELMFKKYEFKCLFWEGVGIHKTDVFESDANFAAFLGTCLQQKQI